GRGRSDRGRERAAPGSWPSRCAYASNLPDIARRRLAGWSAGGLAGAPQRRRAGGGPAAGPAARLMRLRIESPVQLHEIRLQSVERDAEVLGDEAGAGGDGHEIRVAAPARHDVHMVVVGDSGPGDLAEVHAHV